MTSYKTIKDMTPAEYGALALAERRGEALEWLAPPGDMWKDLMYIGTLPEENMVRIKPPEPVTGTVDIITTFFDSGHHYIQATANVPVGRYDFIIPTESGEIVTGTFRDEHGREIVVGKVAK